MFAYIKALIAGFLSVLTFHQGMLWGLDRLDYLQARAWDLSPVPPFEIPAVISMACWGALWGVLLWLLIRRAEAAGYYVGAIILGAILPTAVALSIVPLVHGASLEDLVSGLSVNRVAIGMALNGSFGLGVAVFMRLMHPPR
ncbi:hypothetical protein [Salinisphaera sp. Q1T1-3]|uniref:hypothetical protein n=1 Tax=Salinisphaera sp. Q1T1-3 TaxID=2321229 RepID=UPI000E75D95F|nr:hypothetical protein [Salinisphaera sp. Q1T1-3]RJS91407.1 hypothetical protein D3260_15490 [Salinisphaera sp. Q1T1-3]